MVNYQLGKVYRIIDNKTGKVYIGSTCEPTLARRLGGHKRAYKRYNNGVGFFLTSFFILENDDYEIVLIENYPCNSSFELHQKERFYIENNECVNMAIPSRTENENQQYRIAYREENKNKMNDYYKKNKESILEKRKPKKDIVNERRRIKYKEKQLKLSLQNNNTIA